MEPHHVAAVAVKSATGGWVAAGVWSTVALLSGVLVAIVRYGPDWLKAKISEAERLRRDRRVDYKSLKTDFEKLKLQNTVVIAHCLAVDTRMAQLEWVIGLTLDEIDRLDPSNVVAKKAREMFGRMFPVRPLADELAALNEQLNDIDEIDRKSEKDEDE